jgi:hypothetical protein
MGRIESLDFPHANARQGDRKLSREALMPQTPAQTNRTGAAILCPGLPSPFLTPGMSRRQLLSGFVAVAASSLLTGCGASLARTLTVTSTAAPVPPQPQPQPTPQPTPQPQPVFQPIPSGPITNATLSVTASAVATLAPQFLGLAYEKQSLTTSLFSAANTSLVGLFLRLGPGVLRLGGASVDQCVWTSNGAGQTPGQIAPSDVAALAAFLHATGWSCIYGVNLGGAATGATTPQLAAAEVACVSQQLGDALLSVELGNACETYGASFFAGSQAGSLSGSWSVEAFEALWQQFRSAILAVTPTTTFAGPAAASDVYSWTLPFAEFVTRSQLGLLTQQYTHGLSSNASVDDLVTPDATLATELLDLHYSSQSVDIPFRIDSCAAYDNGGAPGVSNAYASALWAIDIIFQSALNGASGIHFQTGGEQPNTPILDNDGAVIGVQPVLYGLLLSALAGSGSLLSTQLDASSLNVTAYALQNQTSGMSILLVNKDATQNLDLSITLPQSMTSATLQQMTQISAGASAPSLSALNGVTIQGATVATDGSFAPTEPYTVMVSGTSLSCYVPALSAVLLQLT